MEDTSKEPEVRLYRYRSTHQEKLTHEAIHDVDWIYLDQTEYDRMVFDYINTGTYGLAGFMDDDYALVKEELDLVTKDEQEAYEAGIQEGEFIATAKNKMEEWNGTAFRLDKLDDSENPFTTTKVFSCGICGTHAEFTEVAMLGPEMYLSILKEDSHVMWHVCKDCANG